MLTIHPSHCTQLTPQYDNHQLARIKLGQGQHLAAHRWDQGVIFTDEFCISIVLLLNWWNYEATKEISLYFINQFCGKMDLI